MLREVHNELIDKGYNRYERTMAKAWPFIPIVAGWGFWYGMFSNSNVSDSPGNFAINIIGSGIANAWFVLPELAVGIVNSVLVPKAHYEARQALEKGHSKKYMIKNSEGKLLADTNISNLTYYGMGYCNDRIFLKTDSNKILSVDSVAAKYIDKMKEKQIKGNLELILPDSDNKYLKKLESEGILRKEGFEYMPTDKFYNTTVIGVRINPVLSFKRSKYQLVA